MRKTLWMLGVLLAALAAVPAEALNPRFTCTGYTVTYEDGSQRCTIRCTVCRGYDADGNLIYDGEPYCVDHGCIQVY